MGSWELCVFIFGDSMGGTTDSNMFILCCGGLEFEIRNNFGENKKRPQLTSIIAASSGAMKANEVAKKALDGIKSGSFIVPCNFEGLLLSIATAGLSPQRSYLMAFVEVVTAGIVRLAGLCFQWNWYGSIEKWHAQKK